MDFLSVVKLMTDFEPESFTEGTGVILDSIHYYLSTQIIICESTSYWGRCIKSAVSEHVLWMMFCVYEVLSSFHKHKKSSM